jgi:hypothetical protein
MLQQGYNNLTKLRANGEWSQTMEENEEEDCELKWGKQKKKTQKRRGA